MYIFNLVLLFYLLFSIFMSMALYCVAKPAPKNAAANSVGAEGRRGGGGVCV